MNKTKSENREIRELTADELGFVSGGGSAGAGKVTFNPFSITRKIDASSPKFF